MPLPLLARVSLASTSLLLACALTCDANWPHWRGEGGNGVSTQASPPTRWSDTENVKWKVALPGLGSSSPVVWEDKVFVTTAVDPADPSRTDVEPRPLKFEVLCYSRVDGELLWRQTATEGTPPERTHQTNNFASASPCTDGEFLFAHFGSQGLFCYTLDGDFVWKRDFGDMRTRASFGEGSAPTVYGEVILVPWDEEGPSRLFALNKRTGEDIWVAERSDEPSCWATPLVAETETGPQVVMNGDSYFRGYDLKTGEELWRYPNPAQRPVGSAVSGGGLVFLGSGHRGSLVAAIKPEGRGDLEGTDSLAWSKGRDAPDIASPLLSEGRLYFFKGKSGTLNCVDALTGEPYYSNKRTGLRNLYSSPVAAGGKIYATDRNGLTVVVEDSEEFNVLASNDVGETVDATPAPVGNELFIRGEKHLFCIAETGSL